MSKANIKVFTIIFLALLLVMGTVTAFAAPEEDTQPQQEQPKDQITKYEEFPWWQMDDRQISMMIINRQLEYMLSQIEAGDRRLDQISKTYDERFEREIARNRETIQEYENKMVAKDEALKVAQDEVRALEREIAVFHNESGVYLRMLISLLAGLLLGMILSAILRLGKRKDKAVNTASQ